MNVENLPPIDGNIETSDTNRYNMYLSQVNNLYPSKRYNYSNMKNLSISSEGKKMLRNFNKKIFNNNKLKNTSIRRLRNSSFKTYQKLLINNITHILDTLLQGYDNKLRPGYGKRSVIITVDIMIRSMGSISELNMDFTMSMYFRQTWRDERLAYDGPVKILPVSIKILEQIWKPDTYFHNGKESFVHSITVPNRFLRIDNNGSILYSTRLTIKARCPMSLMNFPMDRQVCPLIIGSFGYETKDVIYKWGKKNAVSFTNDLKFSQFAMVHTDSYEVLIDSHIKNSSMLKVEFHFKRHIGYFLLQIYLPCILIVVLSWVSFWINREATADRVGLSITSVLALSAFFLDARSDLPKSPYPTRLDKFVFVCLFYVSSTLIEYAAVHYNTKFGTGELLLSEMLDVKLGYLPKGHQRDKGNDYSEEGTKVDGVMGGGNYRGSLIDRMGNSYRNLRNRRGNISNDQTSKSTSNGSFKHGSSNKKRDYLLMIGKLTILVLFWPFYLLIKLWKCMTSQPKWGNQPGGKEEARRNHEPKVNSVSVLDKICKILFPGSFLIYNYFYWKPYFEE
ncbi:unnamed protein product [Gordionus sp. m RMFG-2023]|uniref:gamma-aminobutyric acid receptor alpha-like n=1 Tax=Gordionus sp. m RMFG-2023 TaxID=3053472 RepID=UPI0030E07147